MQTVDILNLNLFKLKTEKEVFNDMGLTIYQQAEIMFKNWKMTLAIVGESHFLWVQDLFMELLACTELTQQLPEGVEQNEIFKGQELNGLNFAMSEKKLTYSVNVKFEEYKAQAPELLAVNSQPLAFLEEQFPFTVDEVELPCWTMVGLSAVNDCLQLNTSHAYPPNYVVTTCSTIVLP